MNQRNAAISRAIALAKRVHAEVYVYSADDNNDCREYFVSRTADYDLSDEGFDTELEAVVGPFGSVQDADEFRYGPLPCAA